MQLAQVTLDDKYTLPCGRVFLSGVQALVRLPLMQRQRDLAAGLNTAGYISGYRGSPLGGYDVSLWRAKTLLDEHQIHFQPGVNEDLAATAVWGSQQANLFADAKYDGVFAIWYGKGPGVDRSGDALKHGNFAGSARNGGVLCLTGDDHGCKSSTLHHQSEHAFAHYMIPVLNPASVAEYLELGLHGFAMSRFSGCWVAFKAISETVESSASVLVDPDAYVTRMPEDFALPEGGLNIRVSNDKAEMEMRMLTQKLPAAQAYVRANRLDRIVMDAPRARLGVAAAGKAYLDLMEAMAELGIDENRARAFGLRVYKIALSWPIEPEGAARFARGLEEVLVVEEKRSVVEEQLARVLYNRAEMPRRITGKTDETGAPLLPETGELSPLLVGRALVARLKRYAEVSDLEARLARLAEIEERANSNKAAEIRNPFFCSGCPHNTGTRIPEGSIAGAGIGCHALARYIPERRTGMITHMGGEGVNWTGRAPFVETKHIFQNLGDGTYYHSGLMAIRAAVSANTNVTYKILYNDAVAMTGGQPVEGKLTVPQIAHQVAAEGVKRVVVTSDEPEKYDGFKDWPKGTTVHHRDALDRVQRELRKIPGVTVLIHDQTCAAEKRRRRKRGQMVDPPKRVFINDLVCEGCGDCSAKSNCVSVQPLETEFGLKRQIDQSACNKDFSCLKGFCPSFVTVHGGQVRKAVQRAAEADHPLLASLPEAKIPSADRAYGILVTGIGGTGVVTIGALLGMAAHLEGKAVSILDETGLSQKNGAVASHIRIAETGDALRTTRIPTGAADLVLGCDIVVATEGKSLACMSPERTRAVVNSRIVPTSAFVTEGKVDLDERRLLRALEAAAGGENVIPVRAAQMATALLGDSIATNLFILGFAWQRELVPLSREAIERAIEINGVAVAMNKQAFAWGRAAAHDPAAVDAIVKPLDREAPPPPQTLDTLIERRMAFLTAYQNRAYAERYRGLVGRVREAEARTVPGRTGLAEAVTRYYFKLMAYKDEYEVARLYSDGAFREKLERQFDGDYSLTVHLAPPLLARADPVTGEPQKREYGAWAFALFRMLTRLRFLRGTPFDIFGRTEERRTERGLISAYEEAIEGLLPSLTQDNHAVAVAIASLPEHIRGYGHVKMKSIHTAKEEESKLLAMFRSPLPERRDAAE